MPINHGAPRAGQSAIELPHTVKRDLGLDHERSWIVLTELNRFIWPGPDIRIVEGASDPYYGAVPDHLFEQMRDAIIALARANRLRSIKRTE